MQLLVGFLFVLIAGFFQGSFVLPMTLTKEWKWEHTWATFSFLGMLLFNWLLALMIIPDILTIYRSVPSADLGILILFGAGWGVGAILFGLGMDRLGMALGYPIIMGLIASLGALIPLIVFFPATLFEVKGIVLLLGTAIVIVGIVVCTLAGKRKQPAAAGGDVRSGAFSVGLAIAIFAGILSCFPNVGMAFGSSVIRAAEAAGTPSLFAGNAVWALFFTIGFLVNFGYCLFLMLKRGNLKEFGGPHLWRNLGWGALMAIQWIGSFYLYGIGAAKLGKWGVVVGWPLYISFSIVIGNLWGIWKGEWKGAPAQARRLLNIGLLVLIAAVIAIAVSNSL